MKAGVVSPRKCSYFPEQVNPTQIEIQALSSLWEGTCFILSRNLKLTDTFLPGIQNVMMKVGSLV